MLITKKISSLYTEFRAALPAVATVFVVRYVAVVYLGDNGCVRQSEFDIFYSDASLQPLTFVVRSERGK